MDTNDVKNQNKRKITQLVRISPEDYVKIGYSFAPDNESSNDNGLGLVKSFFENPDDICDRIRLTLQKKARWKRYK